MHANRAKEIAEQAQEIFAATYLEMKRGEILDEISDAACGGTFYVDYPLETEEAAQELAKYLQNNCGYKVKYEEKHGKSWLHIRWD